MYRVVNAVNTCEVIPTLGIIGAALLYLVGYLNMEDGYLNVCSAVTVP